jgi:hypothetical protein
MLVAALALSGCPTDVKDEEVPETPGKPTASGGDQQLSVSWAAVERADAYEVWYAPAPETGEADPTERNQYVKAISANKLVITELENETFYHVWIKAKNAGGTSDFSDPVKESPKSPAALPSPPLNLVLEPGNKSITARWTPVPQAEAYDVYYTGGNVLPGAAPLQVTGGDRESAEITGLADGSSYYVWIRSRNSVGSSENSEAKQCATFKDEKVITAFRIGDIEGSINEADKTISLLVPFATNLAQVKPEASISPDATISPAPESPVDFSGGSVAFTVTAQNGTTQVYTVQATKKGKAALTLGWTAGEGFTDPGAGAFTVTALTLVKGDAEKSAADIELQGSFVSYEWHVDNRLKGSGLFSDQQTAIRLHAQDYISGSHRLDIMVYDAAGVPYSKGLSFTVEPEAE